MDLVKRVQGILLKPKDEWTVIKGEKTSVQELFLGYAVILAAIPIAAQFLGMGLILYRGFRLGSFLMFIIIKYVLSLAAVFAGGMVINALAPTFGSKQDQENAMKLAVYSFTPLWIAGALYLIPWIGMLAWIGGLYGAYILYLGFDGALMETPKDKVVGYFAISLIVTVVLIAIVDQVVWRVFFWRAFIPSFGL